MKTYPLVPPAAFSTALAALITVPTFVQAQTDNFDSYVTSADFTAAGWVLSQMTNALVTTTFPATGTGKGLRLQANPVPGRAPAVAIWHRTTEYTNFYMAVDVVDWADKNQAVALLARGFIIDDPGGASGYIVNYNVAQWGDSPASPRQGQLQLSRLSPPFSTEQLAIAAFTLPSGQASRIVFTGTDFHFKVQVYDLLDLSKPLIEMEADDVAVSYTNGFCGLMSYSRSDDGVTDVTVDNYEIGQYNSNPATMPALAHPIPGTPTIETRSPAERFRHAYDPSGGIRFTARTYTSHVINAAATKLRLNGEDVSSQLVLSANGQNISGTLPGTALTSHSVYSGQIEVQDVTGLKKATNTFWFDTFSEAYLGSAEVKIIEAENYNYSNGVHQLDPIPLSGYDLFADPIAPDGVGYFKMAGVEGVDFHDNLGSPEFLWAPEYRPADPVGHSQGMFPELEDASDPFGDDRFSDHVRSQYATNNMLEYVIHRTEPGEWLNYTRTFNSGIYNAYLRVAALGASTVLLDEVITNPTVTGQTTTNLGRFAIPNQFTRYNYRYHPLVDNLGSPVALNLSGPKTMRLTMAGTPGQDNAKLAINYILFVPAPAMIHLLSSATVAGPFTEELDAIVDAGNRTITVSAPGEARFYRLSAPTSLTISNLSVSGGKVTLKY